MNGTPDDPQFWEEEIEDRERFDALPHNAQLEELQRLHEQQKRADREIWHNDRRRLCEALMLTKQMMFPEIMHEVEMQYRVAEKNTARRLVLERENEALRKEVEMLRRELGMKP